MDESKELLAQFQRKPQSKTTRMSTPRVEKGTHKVNDHEIKKEAVVLMYALLEGLKAKNAQVQEAFLASATTMVEKVVRDFGYDKDRIRAAGEKLGNDILEESNDSLILSELESAYKAFGATLETVKKRRFRQGREGSISAEEDIQFSEEAEMRSTRGGRSTKRVRDFHEFDERIERMKSICETLKGNEKVHNNQD